MADRPLALALRRLRSLVSAEAPTDGDGGLLARFLVQRDEAAFAALVVRYGPMVLGTCRRILRHAHDAEDAFQATFLVLARKAGSIRQGESVGGWLYRVAYRTALKARSATALRQRAEQQERQAMPLPGPPSEAMQRELRTVLDAELSRLPAKYREPVVLCYLQGLTNEQAAAELGWPSGSMAKRLARGRELLRGRLLQRGLALSTPAFLGALTEAAQAAVPAALADATVRQAVLFAAGQVGAVPAATLAEGVIEMMFVARLRSWVAVVLLAAGVGALTHLALAGRPPGESRVGPAEAAGKEAGKDQYGDPLPKGALARLGTRRWRHGGIAQHGNAVFFVGFRAGGKQLISAGGDGRFRVWDTETARELRNFANEDVWPRGLPALPALAGASFPRDRVAISADGELLAAATADGAVDLVVPATGKLLRRIETGERDGVNGLASSADGKALFTRGLDGVVRLWDVSTGKERAGLGKANDAPAQNEAGQRNSLAVSGDRKLLAVVEWKRLPMGKRSAAVCVWDVAARKELVRLTETYEAHVTPHAILAFAPNGLLACSRPDGTIRLYQPRTGKEVGRLGAPRPDRRQHEVEVTALAFAPDGKTVVTQSSDAPGTRLWDVATRREVRRLGATPGARRIHEIVRAQVNGFAPNLAFSPDGKLLAAGTAHGAVRVWEVAGGKERLPVRGHQGPVTHLVLSANDKAVTTAGEDATVRHWEARTGRELRRLPLPPGAAHIAIAPDGKTVAFGGAGTTIRIWDAVTGKERRSLAVPGAPPGSTLPGGYRGLAFAADGRALASKDHGPVIRVWDVVTGKQVRAIAEQVGGREEDDVSFPGCFVYSPVGTTLAVGTPAPGRRERSIVHLWDTATGKRVRQIEAPGPLAAIAFSRDGRLVAAATAGNTVLVWDTASGAERYRVQADASCLALAPDGARLATGRAGTADKSVGLWDLKTGKEIARFEGHEGGALSLAFSRDGRRLFSGSLDTTVLAWEVPRAQ
jgi:RNA polymerase sigma factor (sigma-70 family)